jgi:hypothetical protein
MNFEELLAVVKNVNSKRPNPVDEQFLAEIIALVVRKPLDDDRASCQDQMAELIAGRLSK